MGYENQRAKLAEIKEENDKLIVEATKLLDSAIATEEKVMSKKEMKAAKKAAKKASKEASLVIDDVVVVTNEAEVEAVEENRE